MPLISARIYTRQIKLKLMLKILHQAQRYRKLFKADAVGQYVAEIAGSKDYLPAAKRLHARVYFFAGYLSAKDIDGNGHISLEHDPHQLHSTYFVVRRRHDPDTIVAAARQINATKEQHMSFQTVKDLDLYPNARRAILEIAPEKIVEISALVKGRGVDSLPVLLLYRKMWQFSLEQGHEIWLMACDEKLYKRLKFLFGEALVEVGATKFYKGHRVVQCVLEVKRSLNAVQNFRRSHALRSLFTTRLIGFFLHGIPPQVLIQAEKLDIGSLIPSAK